ncbi:MAG TPA: YbhN family protein [Acidimicrobiales bacterium]|nr:YbhN family protein [Acidimicrobiales bacterium]
MTRMEEAPPGPVHGSDPPRPPAVELEARPVRAELQRGAVRAELETGATAPAGGPTPGAGPRPRHHWLPRSWFPRSVRGAITVVVLLFVFEYLLLPQLLTARKDVALLGKVSIAWLLVAVALEAGALVAYAQLTHTVLSPGAPSRWRLFRVNMSSLAVSHVLPGGTAPGTAVGYRLLSESGVPGSTAAFGLATQGVGSALVLNLIFWFSLIISVPLAGYNPLYGIAALAGVLLVVTFGTVVLLLTRGRGRTAHFLQRVAAHVPFLKPDAVSSLAHRVADLLLGLLRDRRLLTRALVWAAANWLLDAASLWVFLFAFGHATFPVDLLVAFGLANVLAVIPVTPSGLGVVEGVLIPTLTGFGVPKAIALLGVISYRLVNFWLPIPAGGLAYLSLRLGRGSRRAGPAGPRDDQQGGGSPSASGGQAQRDQQAGGQQASAGPLSSGGGAEGGGPLPASAGGAEGGGRQVAGG